MAFLLFAGRTALAFVFGLAGAAKLADRAGTRSSFLAFGVPPPLVVPLNWIVPVVEIGLALFLIPAATARWAAAGAFITLLAFSGAIFYNLIQGRSPNCHCFGKLSSRPVIWNTLLRNGLFAALAVLVVWQGPGASVPAVWASLIPAGGWWAAALLMFVLIWLQGWLTLNLMRQNGRLLARVEALEAQALGKGMPAAGRSEAEPAGLPLGEPAPDFLVRGLEGKRVSLQDLLRPGKKLILIFIDPQCGPCMSLLPQVARWQSGEPDGHSLILISRADTAANRAVQEKYRVKNLLLQEGHEVAESYRVRYTPTAVVVWPEGTIGRPAAEGLPAVERLIRAEIAPAAYKTRPEETQPGRASASTPIPGR